MDVIKRDKTKETFQPHKIEAAIQKAFESCGKVTPDSVRKCVLDKYYTEKDISVGVEDIQDNVEKCLM